MRRPVTLWTLVGLLACAILAAALWWRHGLTTPPISDVRVTCSSGMDPTTGVLSYAYVLKAKSRFSADPGMSTPWTCLNVHDWSLDSPFDDPAGCLGHVGVQDHVFEWEAGDGRPLRFPVVLRISLCERTTLPAWESRRPIRREQVVVIQGPGEPVIEDLIPLPALTGTEETLEALRSLSHSSEPMHRFAALRAALSLEQDPPCLDLPRLRKDPDPQVRAAALDVTHAEAFLKDPSPMVRAEAARLLEQADTLPKPGPILMLLEEENPRTRCRALRILARTKPPAISSRILPCLTDGDAQVRADATSALVTLRDPEIIPPLLDFLGQTGPEGRAAALEALGGLDAREAFDGIVSRLDDPDRKVRLAAIRALGITGAGKAALLLPLLSSPDLELQRSAADSIAAMGDPGILPEVIPLVQAPDPGTRAASLRILVHYHPPGCLRLLFESRSDPDERVKEVMRSALWNFRSPAFLEEARSLLQDPEPGIRKEAALFLKQTGERQQR